MTKFHPSLDRAAVIKLVRGLDPVPALQLRQGADSKPPLDREAIRALVRGIDPVDPVQLRLLMGVSPAQRVLTGIMATEFARSALRGAWHHRYPQLSLAELNMKVLACCTPIRMRRP